MAKQETIAFSCNWILSHFYTDFPALQPMQLFKAFIPVDPAGLPSILRDRLPSQLKFFQNKKAAHEKAAFNINIPVGPAGLEPATT